MAVWICLNLTNPSPATNRNVSVSTTNIRLAMNYSSSTSSSNGTFENRHLSAPEVQQHTAVDAVVVARFLSEERRRVVLALDRDKSVIAPQAPAAGVPADEAADLARD